MAWQRVVNKIFRIRLMEKGLAFLGKTVQNILNMAQDVTTRGSSSVISGIGPVILVVKN